ncbi:hypothetical protein BHE74_00052312 [Ensete ventricosum]|uniref:Xyloglucan endotransglucosylase/hydrolase n=1 Tax=Ensete ventricosum TaxID=4639 RepID=A0A426YFZ1_ENSVE|nr:hypothetical protein B296_00051655 [Ensete ventricosum]RWW09692.1 hypothetical protein GW17_00026810 [Ensete ventricosum]RWW42145.1 hypothetical protein BHE74_00052312 [Ensete ventricosum]RZR86514.1 hypothetical protein BHM03_00013733 [Ensete ventricosum]
MALLIQFLVLLMFHCINAQPSPGYYPSSRIESLRFSQGYSNLWGPQHQSVSEDRSSVTIWLDRSSGSGFKSTRPYRNGYFGASIKLQRGYTAGVNTAFYLLTIRHVCSFFVDDVPIRRYARKVEATFPGRPMWVYGSIWDASSWATENGKYKADYRYQPFVSRFTGFKIRGCSAFAPAGCRPVPSSPSGYGLSSQQRAAMQWAQRNHMVYNYCQDYSRDHSLTPEC